MLYDQDKKDKLSKTIEKAHGGQIIPLEEAVRKLTSFPAKNLKKLNR